MTREKKRRVVVEKFVDYERQEHAYLTRIADSILPDPDRDPDGHAIDWAERMYGAVKRFGDNPSQDPMFWHFVLNSSDPATRRFHETAFKAFRELTGTQFFALTEMPRLQTTLGSAALYGKAVYDSAQLQMAWYATAEVGMGVPAVILGRPNPTAEA